MSVQDSAPQSPERNWAIAVWVLYLGGYVTVITIVVGLVIAYIKRPEFAGTPYQSHMTYAIRTFWISIIAGIIGVVLSFVIVGIFLLIALAIWQIYRCVRGIICAADGRPIDNPESWW
jgi:uncharacterized membrane protein